MALKSTFNIITRKVGKEFPILLKTKLVNSPEEDIAHELDNRRFAGCLPNPPVIRYAKALGKQPLKIIEGMLWHEFGHLIETQCGIKAPVKEVKVVVQTFKVKKIKGDDYQDEVTANNNIYVYFGILIKYNEDLVQYV